MLSGGRIDVGIGQGYARHEFAGYGIDRRDRLGRFIEGLDVLEGLLTNEEFSFDGHHYRVDRARLTPRPVQQPMPPLWIGATSAPGVRRAGRRGAHLLGLANRALQREYEAARREAGLDADAARVLQLHWTHVAATDDDAWAEAAPHFRHVLEVYAGWLDEADDPGNHVRNTAVPPVEELRTARTFFTPAFGSAQTVAAAISASAEQVRTTHLCLALLPGMAPSTTRASMERIANDVAPALG